MSMSRRDGSVVKSRYFPCCDSFAVIAIIQIVVRTGQSLLDNLVACKRLVRRRSSSMNYSLNELYCKGKRDGPIAPSPEPLAKWNPRMAAFQA